MEVDEMLQLLYNGADPLEVSIQKWEDIVAGTGKDEVSANCALCESYTCENCPAGDGDTCCDDNYKMWIQHTEDCPRCPECIILAQKMVDYLKGLRK